MKRKIHIKSVHNFSIVNIKNAGPGKRKVITRVRPNDPRFSIGSVFWVLNDGLYELMELTRPKPCNKRIRHMILRPFSMKKAKANLTVYELGGKF